MRNPANADGDHQRGDGRLNKSTYGQQPFTKAVPVGRCLLHLTIVLPSPALAASFVLPEYFAIDPRAGALLLACCLAISLGSVIRKHIKHYAPGILLTHPY